MSRKRTWALETILATHESTLTHPQYKNWNWKILQKKHHFSKIKSIRAVPIGHTICNPREYPHSAPLQDSGLGNSNFLNRSVFFLKKTTYLKDYNATPILTQDLQPLREPRQRLTIWLRISDVKFLDSNFLKIFEKSYKASYLVN